MIIDAQEADNLQEWHWPVRDARGHMYIFSLNEHYLVPNLYILNCTPPRMAEAGRAFRLWRGSAVAGFVWRELHGCGDVLRELVSETPPLR